MPWFSFQNFVLSPDTSAHVNLANGNLLVKANDFTLPSAGFALRHDRYYNGLSTRQGWHGGGWHNSNSTYDIGLSVGGAASSVITFYGPNGIVFTFNRVGTSTAFTSPPGSNLTLTEYPAAPQDLRYRVVANRSGDQYLFATSGILTGTVDRNGVGNTFAFQAGFQTVATVTNASGRGLIYDTPTSVGLLESVRDTAGRKVEYTNDPTTHNLTNVKSVDGKITSYTYDSVGRLRTITLPSAPAATTTVTFDYDSLHRVVRVTEKTGGSDRVTIIEYFGGATSVTDPNDNVSFYYIDSAGRVTTTEDGLGRARSQTWTANSDVATSTDAIGSNTTTYTYDGSANRTNAQLPTGAAASAVYAIGAACSAPNTGTAFQPKCTTDAAGNKKQYQYDGAGNILKQTDTTGSPAVTEFERTYGTCGGFAGQVCTTKDGNGNITAYAYDTHGNLTTVTPPSPLGATTYGYDALGRVTSVTDGNGDTTGYQYDLRDRIVKTTFEDAQTVISTYYANGLEKTRTDSAGGATAYEYNHQGLITKQTGPVTGAVQTYSYDLVGNITSSTNAGGTTAYTYDAANQLVKLTEPGGTCPTSGNPAASSSCLLFEYDQNAQETKRILPGGATVVTARDASGRPTRITGKTGAGATSVDIGYSYTPTGGTGDRTTIQSRTAYAEQGITAGAVTSYSYDTRNRLTLAQEKVGTAVSASWAYAYDNAGNRTQQVRAGSTGAAAGTINYTYNAANQLASATGQSTTWAYDAAGNQTRNGLTGVNATYGDRGETSTIGPTAVDYFGTGNTDRLSLGDDTFTSSALGLTQKTAGSSTQTYTRTPDGGAVGYKATNRWYYVQDHLGSVVGIFSSTGTYSGGYSYSPYGEARSTGTSAAVTTNPLRYISGHHDGNGIYKLGARYYDTTLGRFTQMDPSGQEKNPYAYASCNPINASDPTGLVGCLAQAGDVLWNTAGFIIGSLTIVGAIWAVPAYIEWNAGLYESGQIDADGSFQCEMEWDPRWPNV